MEIVHILHIYYKVNCQVGSGHVSHITVSQTFQYQLVHSDTYNNEPAMYELFNILII